MGVTENLMTPGELARALSIDYHRSFLCVRWAESNIAEGKIDEYGEWSKEVVESIYIRLESEQIDYDVKEGKVINLSQGILANYLEDISKPKKEELSLFRLCEPQEYDRLCKDASKYSMIFNRPHSCRLYYGIQEDLCCGCNSIRGKVNYYAGNQWKYYCGGSPRCCP